MIYTTLMTVKRKRHIFTGLCFTAEEANSTIQLYKNRTPVEVNLEISTDGAAWADYTIGNIITFANVGDKVYIRNKSETDTGFSNYTGNYLFVMNGKIGASGDVTSLLNKNGTMTLTDYCFDILFKDCTSLTTAPELPATTLADYCYSSMFQGCTNLTIASELPATTLADNCYKYMFKGCTSLATAPELPATTLADSCYKNMFEGCTNLTTPPELLATTLSDSCYAQMFSGCVSLTKAPELPATELTNSCYHAMFYKCTSLTTTPELPATTLATYCYFSMFQGCTSLTSLTKLSATILSDFCYGQMFQSCTGIKLSTTQTGEYQIPYRIPTTGTGINANNPFVSMFHLTGGTFTGTPTINTTYYLSNTVI